MRLGDLNATKATIRAGYAPKAARQVAHKLHTKAYIQDAIAGERGAGDSRRLQQESSSLNWFQEPVKTCYRRGNPRGQTRG